MLIAGCPLFSQWPTANLYHFRLGPDGLQQPQMLTAFHPYGYNNQPFFLQENVILLTSDHLSPGMPELWRLDMNKGSLERLSRSAHQEFSPGIRPGTGEISAVRIEPDGQGTQRFWLFDREQPGKGRPVPPALRGVGYYAWKSQDTVAFFLIGDPQLLVFADLVSGSTDTVARNPGRCLRFEPDGQLVFVHKVTSSDWFLKRYSPETGQISIISRVPRGSEDFCLLPDGSILTTTGSLVYRFRQEQGSWEPFADLSGYGLRNLTRIATFNGEQLIIVNQLP